MVRQLSILIPGNERADAVIDRPAIPNVGDPLPVGEAVAEGLEVVELIPPPGDFRCMHATGRLVNRPGASATPL